MKVLVTGGAGFIGSHTVDLLIDRGHKVVVVDNLSSGRQANVNEKAKLYKIDIGRLDSLRIPFGQFEPEAVLHLAAQPSLRYSLDYPGEDAAINIIGTLNVIEACREFSVKHIVFASTSAVYDPNGMPPFLEDDPLNPNLPYGIAKLAGEHYVRALCPSHTILRYGNVYGPRQVPVGENQLIPHALMGMLDGGAFAINGDGYQTRDMVYVGDIARANRIALERRVNGVFNVGTGVGSSVNRICVLLRDLTGWAGDLTYAPGKVGEARDSVLDNYNAKRYLGWAAETALADGLKKTVEAWGR